MRTVISVRHALGVLVALLLAGTLAACNGSGGGESSSVDADRPASAAKGSEGTRNSTGDRFAAGNQDAGGSGGAPEKQPGRQQPGQVTVPAGRAVAYTAELQVRAADVDQAATKAKQMATTAGGYVENESSTTDPATARIALKIPSDRYTSVLDQLTRQLGTKLSLRQEADDVTEQVADVDSRVRSAQAALASFRKLLDKANTVGEVINVEEQLSQRQADLESLQARQKALRESTSYATVTLTLQSPGKVAEDEDREGFAGGLESGWDAFTGFLSGTALVIGWLLPFLALAAVIGVPAYLYRRRRHGREPRRESIPAPAPRPEREPEPAGSGPPE